MTRGHRKGYDNWRNISGNPGTNFQNTRSDPKRNGFRTQEDNLRKTERNTRDSQQRDIRFLEVLDQSIEEYDPIHIEEVTKMKQGNN